MTKAQDPRKVYRTSETPPQLADMLLSELNKRPAHVSGEPKNQFDDGHSAQKSGRIDRTA